MPGEAMSEEGMSWWCTRGGLVTVVEAHTAGEARDRAARAFGHRNVRTKDADRVTARVATGTDLAIWVQLLAQHEGGVAGAQIAELPDGPTVEEPSLFGEPS